MDPQPARAEFLAERLSHLLGTVHPPGRGPYLLREVVEAVNAEAGEELLSVSYLSQLRNGNRAGPRATIVVALARFFGVHPSYFFAEVSDEEAEEQLEVAAALRDNQVRALALRAAGLSPRSLRSILGMIERARELEQLPSDPGDPESPDDAV
jgi:transcriptional regulator with XRE-family HTH domain